MLGVVDEFRDQQGCDGPGADHTATFVIIIKAGEKLLTVGGLPATPMQREAMRIAHEAWMRDGYPEVPPCEAPGYVPRRSSLG